MFSPDARHFAEANRTDNSVLVFGLDVLPDEANKTALPVGQPPETVTFTKDSQKLVIATRNGTGGAAV